MEFSTEITNLRYIGGFLSGKKFWFIWIDQLEIQKGQKKKIGECEEIFQSFWQIRRWRQSLEGSKIGEIREERFGMTGNLY